MSPRVATTILKSAVAVTQSQVIGASPSLISRSHGLHWVILTAIYGGEDRIALVAHGLRSSGLPDSDPQLQQALDLVDRYLSGWRPPDPFAGVDITE